MPGIPLSLVPPGRLAVVVDLEARGPLRRRLIEFGMVPGTEVEVVRRAPLGDPTIFRVLGMLVSMRRAESDLVIVRLAGLGVRPLPTPGEGTEAGDGRERGKEGESSPEPWSGPLIRFDQPFSLRTGNWGLQSSPSCRKGRYPSATSAYHAWRGPRGGNRAVA